MDSGDSCALEPRSEGRGESVGAATGPPRVTTPRPLRTPLPRSCAPTHLAPRGPDPAPGSPCSPGLTALSCPTVPGAQGHPHLVWGALATLPSPPEPPKREQLHVNRPDSALKTAPVVDGEPDLHTSPAPGATTQGVGLLQRAWPRPRASRHWALGSMWPPKPPKRGPFPKGRTFGAQARSPAALESSLSVSAWCPTPSPPRCSKPPTHVQAGVVGEQPVVTQGHVLLLPLLVQGLAAPLKQDALGTEAASETGARPVRHRAWGGSQRPRAPWASTPILPGHCACGSGDTVRDGS